MDEWINKMYMYTYTHTQWILFYEKEGKSNQFVTTGIDLDDIMLNEICQTETNNA